LKGERENRVVNASAAAILRQDLKGKIRWFITLRWIAAVGLALVISAARFILDIPLPLLPLYLGNIFLVLYNGGCHLINRRLQTQTESPHWIAKAHLLANIQILLDLSLLTYLIHFSGGLENPFVFYYIFHMIISSILLTNRSAYLQATVASLLFGLLLAGETLGWLPFRSFSAVGKVADSISITAVLGRFLSFSSTLYIAVYLTTTIVNKLRQREHELEISNQLLAKQDKVKSQYVLTVSHDIQASLSAIESCLQTVLHGFTGRIGDKSRDMVQRATVRSQHLLRFVRDLLDVSRMRTENEIVKEKVNLVALIKKETELFRQQIEEKKISLTFENHAGQVILYANPFSIEQLFNNLLSNAVRYTAEDGAIAVSVDTIENRDTVEVRIADTGIGIDAENLPRIFDDFYRAGNAKAFTENGTGLGLSIAKKIVELHDGEIHVESEVNKGTTFVFSLPKINDCPNAKTALPLENIS
jgi:signal transduction histidine kinase